MICRSDIVSEFLWSFLETANRAVKYGLIQNKAELFGPYLEKYANEAKVSRGTYKKRGPRPFTPSDSKTCPLCGRTLPISDFGKDKGRKDGHKGYCRECMSKKHREWKRRQLGEIL